MRCQCHPTGMSGSCWNAGAESRLGRGKYCGSFAQWIAVKPGSEKGKRVPMGPFCHRGAPAGTSKTPKGFDMPNSLFKHLGKQNLAQQMAIVINFPFEEGCSSSTLMLGADPFAQG